MERNKKMIIGIVIVVLIIIGAYFLLRSSNSVTVVNEQNISTTTNNVATTTKPVNKDQTVIGTSVEGRDIVAYHYGTGGAELLFVGGIHGGYEWNTSLVAYKAMSYLKANPDIIPTGVKVTVIPVLNPDGLYKVVGTTTGNFTAADVKEADIAGFGRFNGNNVDLNRNFDCDWKTNATWQNKAVSGGSAVFSEPESLAIKNYVEANRPNEVIVWYSAAGGVFSSNCHNGVSAETKLLTSVYAKASGYPGSEEFNFYETTGDMTNWLAKINVPAISVLLTNHTDIEWTKNLAGIQALLKNIPK